MLHSKPHFSQKTWGAGVWDWESCRAIPFPTEAKLSLVAEPSGVKGWARAETVSVPGVTLKVPLYKGGTVEIACRTSQRVTFQNR